MHELTVEHVKKLYQQREGGDVVAIDDLNFAVGPGEIVAIVGRTGCGKSTFLRILLGLEKPTEGRLLVGDHEPYESFERLKGQIGVIFQEDRLLEWRTAIENVTLGLEILSVPKKDRLERAREWLGVLGLSDFEDAYPGELSGGMRQRVALARAFTTRPRILLADEAFGHLDEVTAMQLRAEFLSLVEETQSTTLLVTHQLDEALEIGHRTLVFDRPARVIADIDCRNLSDDDRRRLKREIQQAIGSSSADTRENPAP